jgi:hypothetical protein
MNLRSLRMSMFGAMALTMILSGAGVAQAAPGAVTGTERARVGVVLSDGTRGGVVDGRRDVLRERFGSTANAYRTRVVYRHGHRVVVRVAYVRPHHRYHRVHRHYRRYSHR